MKNQQVAEILEKMADLLEFKGEIPFKIAAYRKASRTINDLTEDIETIWQEGRLAEIPGVGKGLQGKIEQFLAEGKIRQLDELLEQVPRDIFELLSIQNFGPKSVALAYKKLGVETLDDLEKVLDDGRLATLPGMGAKKVENIRKGLELRKTAGSRISIGIALPIVDEVISYIKEKAGSKIGRISPAGSVRRNRETVHDIDILAETDHGGEVIEIFTHMPRVTQVLGAGETKGSVVLDDRFQVDLRAVKSESYGAAQQYFTGSKDHNVHLREIAKKNGYKINEYGIYKSEDKVGGEDEKDIYHLLNMSWIPPELRENRGEIEAALKDALPELVTVQDIKADLHIHSTYSDGQLTIEEMAEQVRSMGYSFMAFCDHSKSAVYANGLDEKRLLQEIQEIRQLNEKYDDFVVLAGSEVDILPDGSLDFSDEILAQLDFVVASIHSAFKTDPTMRTLAAMENKYVDVIAHPTGRLISRREGFSLDMDQVIAKAAETGTALEVNSYWDRLDLSDINVKKAVESGVKISINTDSHHPNHLSMMALGVGNARRGWAKKSDVINAMTLDELRAWQKRRKDNEK